ncbi:MAG: FkbM family methyltransferase [Ilumatobacter sp.]|nr:FkbM family methyltransferase [Ilumatobacter sp.]
MTRSSPTRASIQTWVRNHGDTIRRRLAHRLDPDRDADAGTPAPAPPPTTPDEAQAAPPPPLSAFDVTHEQALEWFDNRRTTYQRLCDAVSEHLPADGVVFDVGANIGYFTKALNERSGFTGRAHLFEPVPHLTALCRETMEDVRVDSTVHPFGLSDADSTVTLYVAASGNLGWNTMIAEQTQPGMQQLEIDVRRFDELGIEDVPSLVKIDVEGAEYRVLRGMMSALERWQPRPAILCEIGWGTSHPDWQSELEVFEELSDLGYEVVDLSGEPISIAAIERTTDVIFRPTG